MNTFGNLLKITTFGEFHGITVKPTSSIYKPQQTVDKGGNSVDFQIRGRHDPYILPRVVPIAESMVALVLMDLYLIDNSKK